MTTSTYPVHVAAHLDPHLSRWQWLFKWFLAIPHYIVLAFLWIAFMVLSFVAFFAILFTGRYPRAIFDFNVGVLRWSWRVAYYTYGALATDRYPPFSLEERADYPAHLEVDYPEHLSRGLVLVKWWLLAIPHYLVLALFLGGAGYVVGDADVSDSGSAGGTGLIGLLVCVAAVVLLFTGRYPQALYNFVLGLNRWVIRVAAYAALMTDEYPPFRLDQGGDDPGGPLMTTSAPVAPPVPGASPTGSAPTGWAPTGTSPAVPPTPSRWTPGRVISLVAGSFLLVAALGIGAAGTVAVVADQGLRDDNGFLMSGSEPFSTDTYALTSTSLEIHADAPAAFMPDELLGETKIEASSGQPIFIGIAPTADVDKYLGGVEHATVTDWNDGPVYDTSGGTAPASAPDKQDFWVAQSSGTGDTSISWPVSNGDWTVVVMNADASAGVGADLSAGATVPALGWVSAVLLVAAALSLLIGGALVTASLVSGSSGARQG